uniref:ATP synthase subunit a n=1 Tax=Paracanthobdella livanowi TaxID=2905687 RepID=A0A9E8JY93_9ANNE|nr:ATP synthase F0 subunit 6 [Paracanthobdella livanowi]
MLTDIFSSFDSHEFNSTYLDTTIIFIPSLMIIFISSNLWLLSTRANSLMKILLSVIFNQLMRTNSNILKGFSMMISSTFILLILMNMSGMLPYMFSPSSHLMLSLNLGLPLWLSLLMSSFLTNKKEFMGHLLPDGAPNWLNPFLVIIETISISVRPLTLSFRLAANMSAGHIVLGLSGIYGSSYMFTSNSMMYSMLLITPWYIMFELAICLIQAYIFCLLISLYSDDHTISH